jgi:broad specificity phosphatase PhoE
MDRTNQLILIRHGETEWSRDGRHTGRTDLPLTDAGRKRAVAVGERLRGRHFALVLTSPLQRATETCRLAHPDGPVEVCRDLHEWDYGDYEGRTTDDIHGERPTWSLWADGCPGGEMPDQVAARADRVIQRALAAPGDVALFAHGHILRVLTARWLDLTAAGGRLFALSVATLSILGWEHETRVILRWNG